LVAILAGHHTPPCGKLALIDLNKGQDEGRGISLVAPVRSINYERVDAACQDDVLFQHPYPLNEDVKLSREEMDKLACWIDLAVPYCGDYPESNLRTDGDIRNYNSRLAERVRLSKLEKLD